MKRDTLSTVDRWQLEHALAFPWCWPTDADELVNAARHGLHRLSRNLEPGRVLLVATSGTGRASLWSYGLEAQGSHGGVPFQGNASAARIMAVDVVTRGLPALTALLVERRQQEWVARLIAKSGAGMDQALDGPSFGLSFALATVGQLLGQAVPSNLVASASLASDGTLRPVGGLDEKVRVLSETARGVRVLLVAEEDEQGAKEAVARCGGDLRVSGVPNILEACRRAFPEVSQRQPSWAGDARLRRTTDPLLPFLLRQARTDHEKQRKQESPGTHRDLGTRSGELYAMSCAAVCDCLCGEVSSARLVSQQVLRAYGAALPLPPGFRHHAAYAFAALIDGRDREADEAFAQLGTGRYRSEEVRGVLEQRDLVLRVLGKLPTVTDPESQATRSSPVPVGHFSQQARQPRQPGEVYTPRPRGTGYELDDGMMRVVEDLARNAHDVWATERVSQGWSYGDKRNDEARLHPDLVDYDELTEIEKNVDRVMVAGTVKALLDLGYVIKRR